jgi:23S rRNA (cytosine1962-C5)-methyltransferase
VSPAAGHPRVRVRPRGARRLRSGHPWIFRDDVEELGGSAHGDLVQVLGPQGAPLGWAFVSLHSKITLRLLRRGDVPPPDEASWRSRVAEAIAWRDRACPGREAVRLVFGESDGLPGLVADLYGRHLVVQVLTAGTERLLPLWIDAIAEHRTIDSVLARNDSGVRALEGLPREVVPLRGTPPDRIEVREGEIRYLVDPWKGQKTGAFLDQADNRIAAARFSRGRVLDAFAYHGSFALHAARTAESVVVVDASADALARAAENAALNDLGNLEFVEANVFDDLRARERAGERFDLVLLDPPAFAKSRGDLAEARRGYKEVNLRALRLLAPGGVLVTSSCSYNLGEPEFMDLIAEAAADAGVEATILARRGQAVDHPVRLGFPESRYLKCVILARRGLEG